MRAMFDRIAGVYDVMNSVMTAGLHHTLAPPRGRPRARSARATRVLDVATGTGDLALELAARVGPAARSSARTSPRRCSRARARRRRRARRWEWGNALELPYDDERFDAATVGFGARNFSDLDRGLREMARVVRPGGRVVVLEITTPTRPPLSTLLPRCGSTASCR